MQSSIHRAKLFARPTFARAALAIPVIVLVPARAQAANTPAKTDAASNAAPANLQYGPDTSDELGNMAVVANPSVRAIQARVGALEQRVRQAGVWMDPTFSAEYSSMPIDKPIPGEHPMSGIQFTLRQTFYWPGKIDARQDEAQSRVRQEQLSLDEQRVQLRATVRRAYYRLALTRQLRDVTRENVQLVKDFIDVVRIKVESGLAAQHELLRLRVLEDQLQDDIKNFDRDEASLTSGVNATLHRDIDTPVLTPQQTAAPEPVRDAKSLAQRAEQERPLLKRFTAEAETYQADARRARREGYSEHRCARREGWRRRRVGLASHGRDSHIR